MLMPDVMLCDGLVLWEAAAKSFELDMQTFSQLNKAPVVMGRLCKVFQRRFLWARAAQDGFRREGRKSLCWLCSKRCFPPANTEPWHSSQHDTATPRAGGRAREAKAAEENLEPGFKNL